MSGPLILPNESTSGVGIGVLFAYQRDDRPVFGKRPAEPSEDYQAALDALEGMEASDVAIANAQDILMRVRHHPMLLVTEDEDGAVSVEAFSSKTSERRVWIICSSDRSVLCLVRDENDTQRYHTTTYRHSSLFADTLRDVVMTLDSSHG